MIPRQHMVRFYENDVFLTEAVASCIKLGLQVNDTLIVMVPASHRTALRKVLTPDELANKHLMFFGTTSLLTKVMGDDWPNQRKFMKVLGRRIQVAYQAVRGRVLGEMLGVLWAEGKYRAAKAFVREAWSDAAASLEAGTPLSVRQHTLLRLALANITWSCHEVCEFAYTAAGTIALRSGTMQRLFRDMHAGTQHITSAPPVIRNTGRELAGVAAGKTWLFLDLVDQA